MQHGDCRGSRPGGPRHPGGSIEDAPRFGASVNTDFILGMGKVGDAVKILLDIDKVLAGDHFDGLA